MDITTKNGRIVEYNRASGTHCDNLSHYFIENYFDEWEPIVNEFSTKKDRFEFLSSIGIGVRENTKKADIALQSVDHHSIPNIVDYLNIDDDLLSEKIELAKIEHKRWFNEAYASYRKKR